MRETIPICYDNNFFYYTYTNKENIVGAIAATSYKMIRQWRQSGAIWSRGSGEKRGE